MPKHSQVSFRCATLGRESVRAHTNQHPTEGHPPSESQAEWLVKPRLATLKSPFLRGGFPHLPQELSRDPNPQYFLKSTAIQMGGVLPYKWEAYCSTIGRRIAGFPFLRSLEARKVRRYKWGAYCCTNWRCTAVLFRQVVGVGASETLPTSGCQ